jgi:hypothetical protein
MSGEAGQRLKDLIEKAMDDLEITSSEYMEIMAAAGEDGFEDAGERALLGEFNALIGNGTIKRVPG